ncbi:(2Fe-2S)-binding protein [Roseiconus lacunae]|uniref:(2Fe-2S)-binding protein n=1 Tax=Roseiconus lacunae TaxID=2605694 RepID=A0ABT7PKQ7_9BACT|nr:(2Fe-2S)-binding protein [Roseiconus lacunae]MCD0460726.1 (2Fe-2S)-binding protein [Roseiconus lacunae]MDM4017079.1 (2Fe-2S)-binding protein [Roseiconus lacunae]WRQ51340.1 (2Fe-2S)-binding protein [Stieleria sp. HD01]
MTDDDQQICLCFRVSRRKLEKFIRTTQPKAASQLSECYGAGTGCGWCRPFLKRLWQAQEPSNESLPSPEQYAQQRASYRQRRQAERQR